MTHTSLLRFWYLVSNRWALGSLLVNSLSTQRGVKRFRWWPFVSYLLLQKYYIHDNGSIFMQTYTYMTWQMCPHLQNSQQYYDVWYYAQIHSKLVGDPKQKDTTFEWAVIWCLVMLHCVKGLNQTTEVYPQQIVEGLNYKPFKCRPYTTSHMVLRQACSLREVHPTTADRSYTTNMWLVTWQLVT